MWIEWVYLLCLSLGLAAPFRDRIRGLPGLDEVIQFPQYSGHLILRSKNQLFYWLTAAEEFDESPVIVWLNGGPGCSSMSGLWSEMGPFRVNGDGQVSLNPYAWNQYANIVFLDAPAGVGFSVLYGLNYTFTDRRVADENYEALKLFFFKFPELSQNDLYVAGESYGGTYVPMLGDLITRDPAHFPNFKGIIIGNGCMNEKLRVNSQVPFNYMHGLVSERSAEERCCESGQNCDWYQIMKTGSKECQKMAQMLDEANFMSGLDPYLLDYSCYPDDANTALDERPTFYMRHRLSQVTQVKSCQHENEFVSYLNRGDVQRAIHVNKKFESCSKQVSEKYVVEYEDMSPFVQRLQKAGKRILLFNGDMDSVCTHIHNQQFVDGLGLQLKSDRREWKMKDRVPETAGFCTQYDGLDFVTVNGGGHFVASTYEKPREALQLFYNFIHNRNYSEPVEPSATHNNMYTIHGNSQ